MLDLDYRRIQRNVDFNVMTDRDEFVELQGTAERFPFSTTALTTLLDLGRHGIREVDRDQQNT